MGGAGELFAICLVVAVLLLISLLFLFVVGVAVRPVLLVLAVSARTSSLVGADPAR